jgi:hypothetical protein
VISVNERHGGKNKCGKRQFAATSSGQSNRFRREGWVADWQSATQPVASKPAPHFVFQSAENQPESPRASPANSTAA